MDTDESRSSPAASTTTTTTNTANNNPFEAERRILLEQYVKIERMNRCHPVWVDGPLLFLSKCGDCWNSSLLISCLV